MSTTNPPFDDSLPFSPAADRNKGVILAELARVLPARARVLEVASGTGQHAAHFAAQQPQWTWQPTDFDERSLPAIAARCAGLAGVLAPLRLDVLQQPWPTELGEPATLDGVYCANMIHISPWATCGGLMAGAARLLKPGGVLLTYGPYIVDGIETAPSNLAFDADLKARDPQWGLRRLADVQAEGAAVGLAFEERVTMPANNLLLVFRLSSSAGSRS